MSLCPGRFWPQPTHTQASSSLLHVAGLRGRARAAARGRRRHGKGKHGGRQGGGSAAGGAEALGGGQRGSVEMRLGSAEQGGA